MPNVKSNWLPYAKLNLLRNPFGQLSQEDRIAAAIVDTESWLDRLADNRYALQFMGECGRGKTTHLLALLARCEAGAYVYLPEDGPLPPIPTGNPLFVDEAQRLPRWIRSQVFRRSVPLVLGTHADLAVPLTRAGYDVETVDVTSFFSHARVHQALARRIELARLGPGALPELSAQEVSRLIEEFGDDLRSMEDRLYEMFQAALANGDEFAWRNAI